MNDQDLTVAVLIPVYHPDKKLNKLLSMLKHQSYAVEQVVITETLKDGESGHSYSKSGLDVDVIRVRKEDFDHAGTRSLGMDMVRADICICMTQDAVPADDKLVESLVNALKMRGPAGEITAAAYARQIPREECRLVERYTRSFNYPSKSSVKTAADIDVLGIKTYFCSNVCAAYDMQIYRRMGGFGQHEIFNEDMIFASRLIKAGYAVAYAAGARVVHSHNYTLSQQFHRNYDLAVSQAMHPEIFAGVSSESEGVRLVEQSALYLIRKGKVWLIPGLIAQSGAKYLGYRLGLIYTRLPKKLNLAFTGNKDYWNI